VPAGLVWILMIGTFSVLRSEGRSTAQLLLIVAVAALVLIGVAWIFEGRGAEVEEEDEEPVRGGRAGDGQTAFPTPPMDLVVPPSPRLRARRPVTVPPDPDTDSDTDPTGETR